MNDTLLNLLHEVGVFLIGNNELLSLGLLDPVHRLSLWINIEGPSKTFGNKDTILGGEGISW